MGQLAILHPQPLLKIHPNTMRSPPTIKFMMNPPSQQTPNFTTTAAAVADGRRRTQPPKGILKKKKKNDRNTEAAAVTESKKLVMGEVKILKRGESLNTVLKEVNHHHPATSPEKKKPTVVADRRKVSRVSIGGGRRGLPKTENLSPKLEASKDEDVLCSTNRLGPDPEVVSKQMKKVSACFAGSAFSDSPPPSSVPLPGFFRKKLDKDDATTNLRRILGLSLV